MGGKHLSLSVLCETKISLFPSITLTSLWNPRVPGEPGLGTTVLDSDLSEGVKPRKPWPLDRLEACWSPMGGSERGACKARGEEWPETDSFLPPGRERSLWTGGVGKRLTCVPSQDCAPGRPCLSPSWCPRPPWPDAGSALQRAHPDLEPWGCSGVRSYRNRNRKQTC